MTSSALGLMISSALGLEILAELYHSSQQPREELCWPQVETRGAQVAWLSASRMEVETLSWLPWEGECDAVWRMHQAWGHSMVLQACTWVLQEQ